jgi:hypothetical protein
LLERLEREQAHGGDGAPGRESSGRRGSDEPEATPLPPPLFVHKRRRDGAIEPLSRAAETPNAPGGEVIASA